MGIWAVVCSDSTKIWIMAMVEWLMAAALWVYDSTRPLSASLAVQDPTASRHVAYDFVNAPVTSLNMNTDEGSDVSLC